MLEKLKRSVRKRIYRKRLLRKIGQNWSEETGHAEFVKRQYGSYEDYLEHQSAKLDLHDFKNYDSDYRNALRERLRSLPLEWAGRSALCLAARLGTEVRAFLDLGCFAVGLDLNPGKQNKYVLHGDFHQLQFSDSSVDFVFTNSLDHAFDLDRLTAEIRRVLKTKGALLVEAVQGKAEGKGPAFFESFYWAKIDDLVAHFERSGFRLGQRKEFDYPWRGQQLWFEKK